MRQHYQIKIRMGKEKLYCSDVIFQIINDSLKRIEPVVYGFAREADILSRLVEEGVMTKSSERGGILKRAYMAKEYAMDIEKEISDKYSFLKKYKKLGKKGIMRFQGVAKARFLTSKAREMKYVMARASFEIELSIEKYAQYIDIEMTAATKNVNKIMMLFTIVTLVVMPPQIIGGIMGMNVLVPG